MVKVLFICHSGSRYRYHAKGTEAVGAPVASSATAQAMDQGTRGDRTTAVFSMHRASRSGAIPKPLLS